MTFPWNILGNREKLDENGVFLTKLTIKTKCWKSQSCKKYMYMVEFFWYKLIFQKKIFQKESYDLIRFYYSAILWRYYLSKNLIRWSNFYTQLRNRKKMITHSIFYKEYFWNFNIEWKSDSGYKNILKAEKFEKISLLFWRLLGTT